MFCIIRHKADKFSGACSYALSAGFTSFLIDYRNTVYNVNRIKRTNSNAGAAAETAFSAGFGAAAGHKVNDSAVLRAYVLIIFLGLLTVTHAGNKRNLLYGSGRFRAHDGCDLISYFTSAYGASVNGSFAFYDCRSQAGASGISASSTVISGKSCQYFLFSFISFYFKNNTCCAEEQSYKYSDACCTQCSC